MRAALLLPLLALASARVREDHLQLATGLEGKSEGNQTELREEDLPDYLEVVVAKRPELALSPGLETGATGQGSDEDNQSLPAYLDVVEAAKRQVLSPGLETGASGEGTEEDNNSLPASLDVVEVAKRSEETLVEGYEFKKNDMKNPDKRAEGDFSLGDIVDLSTVPEQVASKFSGDPNEAATEKDIPGQALNPEDYYQADMVKDMAMDFTEDPILLAQLWEGDIANVLPDYLQQMMGLNARAGINRNAIKDSWRRWPDATIPYVISSEFSQHERSVIAKAMQEYHQRTCIRFRPRTSEKAYIHIMKGSGCSSSVGRTGSRQTVSLGNGCVYAGIVMHELMHASGFWHEQSRADRDEYVQINWENIMTGMEYNFLKYDLRKIDHLGAKYDTCSVMHYGPTSFAKSWGKKTIVSRHKDDKCKLGQRKGFSDTDIRKLNTLYKCKGYPQVGGHGSISVTPKPTPRPTSKPTVVTCEDSHKHCNYWAEKDECKKNPEWMLVSCPVSCEQCKNKCDDNNVYCKDWAKLGECTKNPDYMNIYCAKSCKKCVGDCDDENSSCRKWADKGYCKSGSYTNYMKLRCKDSCKLC